MKIDIVGPGSMGIVLSYFLHKENEVVLTVKKGEKEFYEKGLKLLNSGGSREFRVKISEELEKCDVTIIAVKSYDLDSVYNNHNLRGKIILIQNGLYHLNMKKDGIEKFYAVTTWGSKRTSKGVAELTGKGYFRLGSEDGHMDLEFLRKSGINAEWVDDIRQELYRKASINAVINPITSLFGVKNGFVAENEELWRIASMVIEELEELFSRMGYGLEIKKNVLETCKVTSENTSSMLQDIQQGKRSEIDSITGEIIALGDSHNLKMKANRFLYESIKFLQSRDRTPV